MKWIISSQWPDSPPPQGASDPISVLAGLCVYLFYPNLFSSQINIITPLPPAKKKIKNVPFNLGWQYHSENDIF